ncbi:hypothetical protein D918_05158 [Trichuris suis]|nr:hypothetical protein D918_05158 [Trichuris suis]
METTQLDKSVDVKLIPEYDGSARHSITEWLEKVELACRLPGIDDLATVIPLQLTGGAFAVYMQLTAEDQKDPAKESAASGRVTVEVIVADMQPLGFDFILGMNGITPLGGVSIDGERRVRFGGEQCAVVCAATPAGVRLEEKNFASDGEGPAVLKNYVGEHPPAARARAQYEEEDQPDQAPYPVGDKVWVRPPDVRCDSEYQSGTITASLPRHAVYVDGTPHHVRDLRRRTSPEESPSERLQTEDSYDDVAGPSAARMAPSDEDPEAGQGALRRSSRLRKARSLNSCDS